MPSRHNIEHVIDKMQESHGYTSRADARTAIRSVLSSVWTVAKDGPVVLSGVGTFEHVVRKARKGQNPRTGESVDIPARRKPLFRPSPNLIDAMLEDGDVPAERKPYSN